MGVVPSCPKYSLPVPTTATFLASMESFFGEENVGKTPASRGKIAIPNFGDFVVVVVVLVVFSVSFCVVFVTFWTKF